MIDLILFAGRIILVIVLYIFLYCVMKTGIGLVKGQRKDGAIWTVTAEKGPRGVRGLQVEILGPTIIGRSPNADIVIGEPYVSGRHARFSLQGPALVIEDLDSTNGTLANGHPVVGPVALHEGDEVSVGDVILKVTRK